MEKELIPTEESKPPLSRLAMTSFVMLCLPFILLPMSAFLYSFETFRDKPAISVIFAVVASSLGLSIIASTWVGIVALFIVAKSKSPLRGKDFAVATVIISTLIILFFIGMPYGGRVKPIAQRVICGTNLKGIATALTVYANDYYDKLPDRLWCDLLIEEADVHPKSFACPASDLIEGECSYALNKYITSLKNVPPDLVLLFETKNSHQSGNMGPIKNREGFSKFSILQELFSGNEEVALDCWNPKGGPELLSTANHHYLGCNIGFTDGHTEWVTYKDLPSLKWSIDNPDLHWTPEVIPPVEGILIPYWVSGIILGCVLLFGQMSLNKSQILLCLLSGILSSVTGFICGGMLGGIYPSIHRPYFGFQAGLVWGAIAGIIYARWLIRNLSRNEDIRRYYPYAGILIGVICGLLTNITLILYYNEFEFASFGLACYGGLPAGAIMGVLLGNLFDRMVKSPKPIE